ncbi:hypothetical protein EK904_011801 [Melospiza melodia maxima]|nr:hypothetical protein EK904_011801 [Melospiza melodia maxima]
MAVVIRLQGLPVVAGPPDIRRFFLGLNIPDGGVHIIGGEIGEAFIIFATDEDARRAMSCSGGFIKDSRIELFLSSKAEMQSTIEMSRKRFDRGGRETMSGSRRTGTNGSSASSIGDIPHLVTASPKGIRKPSYGPPNRLEAGFHTNGTRYGDMGMPKSNYQLRKDCHPFNPDDRYLFLRGIPYSATEMEVRAFLSGIRVDGVILIKHRNGLNNVQKFFSRFDIDEDDIYLLYDEKGVGLGEALVKFKSEEQAMKAENLNRQTFLGTEVLIRLISQDQMQKFGVAASLSAPNEMHGHSHPYDRGDLSRPVGSPSGPPQGPPMHSFGPPGNFRHHSEFRHPPEDFMCPPKDFRGPPPLMDFGGDGEPFGRMEFGNNKMGNFPEGRFMPDPNFSGGSERVVPILLKNLPFKATPNEILDFFYGYRVIPESVSVQYNEQGLPSGDAIVAMTNYEEAMAAINELNDRPIGPRKVKLSLL